MVWKGSEGGNLQTAFVSILLSRDQGYKSDYNYNTVHYFLQAGHQF